MWQRRFKWPEASVGSLRSIMNAGTHEIFYVLKWMKEACRGLLTRLSGRAKEKNLPSLVLLSVCESRMPTNNQVIVDPREWRSFSATLPIGSCYLPRQELKRLYQLIDTKQKEYRDVMLAQQFRTPQESEEQFEARKKLIENAFVTSVVITGQNHEVITANNEDIFEKEYMPTVIKSILYTTRSVPNAVLNHFPGDWIDVFLDFSSPPLFDFERLPTFPTPNASTIRIEARNEQWFSAAKARLSEFFGERSTGVNWLHRAATYDILLGVVGLPIATWVSIKVGLHFKELDVLAIFPRSLVYVLMFFLSILAFRVTFSYARWTLPKVEVSSNGATRQVGHRVAIAAILLGIGGSFVYDLLKLLVFG